ncbi:hypothetical protein EON65_01275 [archaeon]|nr:MAG: hypothetical protein EON65_01275 [archaeon]
MKFIREKHITYVRQVSSDTESFEYLVSQHLRMSGVYWGLTAMYLLGVNLKEEPSSVGMVDWILTCFDAESGGFGGNTNHDAHILYTLSAIQILALYDEMQVLNKEKIKSFVKSLQQPDGSFAGDKWGEIDTRFSYCALSILSLLGCLHDGTIDVKKAVDFVSRYVSQASFGLFTASWFPSLPLLLFLLYPVYYFLAVRTLTVALEQSPVQSPMLVRSSAVWGRCL